MPTQHPGDSFAAHRFNPLDIPTHLLERFEESPLLNFPPAAAPAETGIYGLYLRQELVYIGKAARGSNLKRRFAEHARKIGGRKTSNFRRCSADSSSLQRNGSTMRNII
jgi:hypothetical protein